MDENIEITDLMLVYIFDAMEDAENAYLRDKDVPFINEEVVKCLLDSYLNAEQCWKDAVALHMKQAIDKKESKMTLQ